MLFIGERIVIHESTRKEMLNILQEGHQGLPEIKAHGSQSVYWSKMKATIDRLCLMCGTQ